MKSDPLELLAMLTAHGPDMLARGRGGIPELTPLDVAAALGMAHLSRVESLLLLAKYTQDISQVRPLALAWYLHVVDIAYRDAWEIERGVPRLLRLALWTLRPALLEMRCESCGGPGLHHNQRVCATCSGTGIAAAPTVGEAAAWLLVKRADYLATWSRRETALAADLQLAETHAEAAIRRALRNREPRAQEQEQGL